jgi:hypothetical protein
MGRARVVDVRAVSASRGVPPWSAYVRRDTQFLPGEGIHAASGLNQSINLSPLSPPFTSSLFPLSPSGILLNQSRRCDQ